MQKMNSVADEIIEQFNDLPSGTIEFHFSSAALYPNAFDRTLLITHRIKGEPFDAYLNVLEDSPELDAIADETVRHVTTEQTFKDGDILKIVRLHVTSTKKKRALSWGQ